MLNLKSMKRCLLLSFCLLLPHISFGQDRPRLIGEIEFFGYAGVDLERVRAALPFHEQESYIAEDYAAKLERAREAIKNITGHFPTGMDSVCCDSRGNQIIFIGLSGKTAKYNPPPQGTARLPEVALNLYDRFITLLFESLQKGIFSEDHSKGYALSAYPPLRSVQLEMREYAVNRGALLRSVLATSSADRQRIAAAHLLGYARQSDAQFASLVKATRDRHETVRNNATRALLVLALSSPKIASRIPAASFVELLLSGTWTDLNKGGELLNIVTARSRGATVFARLHSKEVLERLIEMARWRSHGEAAANLLGRVAGIDEQRLQRLVAEGKVEAIIKELQDKRGQGL